MSKPLRIAAVGDLVTTRPLTPIAAGDEGFADVVALLRGADATFGNLETAIVGLEEPGIHPWGVPDDWSVRADPAVAADLRDVGFDVVGRANNHALDWGPAGLTATTRALDAAGLAHAGAGDTAAAAGAVRFHETPAGRVALVSATTWPSPPDTARALDAHGEVPARPGVNTLGVATTIVAPPEGLAFVHDVIAAAPELSTAWMTLPGLVELSRSQVVEGPEVEVRYEVDGDDRRRVLRAVRLGAQDSDVCLLAIHTHHGDAPELYPPTFLRELAKAAIDAGAHLVAISGPHRIAPVEVHRGRPIFFGLGNFLWSDLGAPVQGYMWERTRQALGDAAPDPATATDADLLNLLNADAFDAPEVFHALVAEVTVDAGEVRDITLRPVDLGRDRLLTERGIPRTPVPDVASAILRHVATISAPMDTTIDAGLHQGVVALP